MAQGLVTDVTTVSLAIAAEPRQFVPQGATRDLLDEAYLLNSHQHIVLLGDPGSGKTTTLKRTVRRVMLAEPSGSDDIWRYPLVLRLRDLRPIDTIATAVADILGIFYTETQASGMGQPEYEVRSGIPLEVLIAEALDAANVVLCVDGLDELPRETRESARDELVRIGYKLSAAKIIVTTRSGDLNRNMDGFRILELLPLTREQQERVAGHWLDEPSRFFEATDASPYADTIGRPLLLAQLLSIFRMTRSLPEQPSRVYKRLVHLMLDDWNTRQGVPRVSAYAGFEPSRQAEFLAAVAYHLTYVTRSTEFSVPDFLRIYDAIRHLFKLPLDQGRAVAREIETHTGLIQRASSTTYEFAHLSLQEYLSADYMVRLPLPRILAPYIRANLDPLAIAVALSGDPGEWLAALYMHGDVSQELTAPHISSFMRRLQVEQPTFVESMALGTMGIMLAMTHGDDPGFNVAASWLFAHPGVAASIGSALSRNFDVPPQPFGQTKIGFRRKASPPDKDMLEGPVDIVMPTWCLEGVLKVQPHALLVRSPADGQLSYLSVIDGLSATEPVSGK